jgi:hypothetical protein
MSDETKTKQIITKQHFGRDREGVNTMNAARIEKRGSHQLHHLTGSLPPSNAN